MLIVFPPNRGDRTNSGSLGTSRCTNVESFVAATFLIALLSCAGFGTKHAKAERKIALLETFRSLWRYEESANHVRIVKQCAGVYKSTDRVDVWT